MKMLTVYSVLKLFVYCKHIQPTVMFIGNIFLHLGCYRPIYRVDFNATPRIYDAG